MPILIRRLLIALIIALPFVGVALFMTQISADAAGPTQSAADCATCHPTFYDEWSTGLHGQANTNPAFLESWNAEGKPGACLVCHTTGYDPASGVSLADGVDCLACHNPIPSNHPTDNMPVDTSPDLCGKCHSDPSFATGEWQLSAHYQRGMTCSVCHDPHTAGMKTISAGGVVSPDASDLCSNCHKEAMQNFPTSKHAEAGVTCVNCHLGFDPEDKSFEASHKAPAHDFVPSLKTCNKCHANQMHAPGEAVAAAAIKIEQTGGTPTPEPTLVVTAIPAVNAEPLPVSPLGFAGLAGLLGLGGGMVLAPWLERAYRHWNEGR
jgi:predicted CXXCH cytochrome family protein